MAIHPTAIVDPSAALAEVEIGPYAIIGAGVTLHQGVRVEAHAVVLGPTEVGPRTVVGHHAVLGGAPQDHKHDGGPTRLLIGSDNVLREYVTAHRGSSAGTGLTRIGDRNTFMVGSHVAHDCAVGSGCTFANGVALAGHVVVEDQAVLGGMAGIHQFARVGRLAMIGAGAMCAQDVPPFLTAWGDRARLRGLNLVGMERAGLGEAVPAVQAAVARLFARGRPTEVALAEVEARWGEAPEVAALLSFLRSARRGVCRWAEA
ncbi:MAG: acyl-ACP--UDP-N-acetylglucosamine O-acyltransferase [Deltaproteobacteria bacterium]|nr:acyl-ACP--UDP-N-acetylglucosamine O-acyltransferase [Deltaproteobacteria bacterium]